jgi:hypothetical protein
MKYTVTRISGNAFRIKLKPGTPWEQQLLAENRDRSLIEAHYQTAVICKFGDHARPASLTPADDFPFEAIVEVFTESGSV